MELTLTQKVAERLRVSVGNLGMVGDAADFNSIRRETMKFPAAFVVPLGDRGGPNGLTGNAVSQRREPRFGVVLAVRNVRATRGASALLDVEQLRADVDAALIGWQPADKYDPVLYASGNLLSMENGELWWQDEYLTAYQHWRAA